MGAEIGVGALLAASGVSALGNIAGSAISANGAQGANSQAMAFNAQQAQLNREWQEKMYKQQLGDQEAMYNKYQSPEAIAKALQKIGVNAAGAFSGGNSGFSGSLPSVPGVPSGSQAAIGSLENPYASYSQAAKGVAGDAVNVLNAITDKKLKDAQAIKALQETNNLKVQEDILKWTDMINNTVGSQKAKEELNSIIVQTGLYAAQGKLTKAQELVAETIQKLNNKEFEIKSEELSQLTLRGLFLEQSLKSGLDLQKEEIKTEQSKQAANYASADESKTRKLGLEFENAIKKIDSENAAATAQHKLAALREQYMKDATISQLDRVAAQKDFEKLDKILRMYREHPNKAALDAALDNFNEHFPLIGGFIKAFK